ncbi:hypothetical protein ACETRX_30120 [Labrys portucalensis]|uniref:Transmembrane anchored protein n=1 Tax=Labrys neptuniae TaxID=376174 RepID=A0ABV6ZP01_9HYPH
MIRIVFAAIVAGVFSMTVAPAFAGSCDHSWQQAKDGSICGDRAADRRQGGDDD